MPASKHRLARTGVSIAVAAALAPLGFQPAVAGHAPGTARPGNGAWRGTWVTAFGPGMHQVRIPAAGPATGPTAFGYLWIAGRMTRIRPAGGRTARSSTGISHRAGPRAGAGLDATGPRYPLAISVIGRNGKPADVGGFIFDTASKSGNVHHIATHGGTARIRLPAGRYLIDVGGLERPPKHPVDVQFFVPFRLAKGHTHLALDARRTRPVTVSLDGRKPAAGQFTALAYWGGKLRTADFIFAKPGTLYVMPVHAAPIRFSSQWDIYGQGRAGTHQYVLAANHLAGVPAHPSYQFKTSALAAVRDTYLGQDATAQAGGTWFPVLPGMLFSEAVQHFSALPNTITHYLMPHVAYFGMFDTGNANKPDETVTTGQRFTTGAHAQTWNTAVIGPRVPAGDATRTGDSLAYSTQGFFTDAAPPGDGHFGLDYAATGTIALARNGKTVATAPFQHTYPHPGRLIAQLPSAPALYTLAVSASRHVPYATLSTRLTATWSFSSAHTAARSALPLLTVRCQVPHLNGQNQAKAGTIVHIPLWVTGETRTGRARVTRLTVQASADGGRTWHPVTLARAGDHWVAALHNPATPGYVSLRSTAADGAGDTVTQTIIRAYAVTFITGTKVQKASTTPTPSR